MSPYKLEIHQITHISMENLKIDNFCSHLQSFFYFLCEKRLFQQIGLYFFSVVLQIFCFILMNPSRFFTLTVNLISISIFTFLSDSSCSFIFLQFEKVPTEYFCNFFCHFHFFSLFIPLVNSLVLCF